MAKNRDILADLRWRLKAIGRKIGRLYGKIADLTFAEKRTQEEIEKEERRRGMR